MDEVDDIVRASLTDAIDAEFFQQGEPIPNVDVTAFTLNFEAESTAGLISDKKDTEDQEEKNSKKECCRMCGCDDKKLNTISPQNRVAFHYAFEHDEDKSIDPRISLKACTDCNGRMTSFRMFRTKAIQTNTLLYSLLRPFLSVSEQSSTAEGIPSRSELLGQFGNPQCFIRRRGRSQPYQLLTGDPIPFRQHRLSFCVLQRSPPRTNHWEPRRPE